MEGHRYDYAVAEVVKVVDGDTLDLRVETDWQGDPMPDGASVIRTTPWTDVGFYVELQARTWVAPTTGWLTVGVQTRSRTAHRFRLLGVDTPERGEAGYTEATEFVRAWVADARVGMRVATTKGDSFGRWLAEVRDQHGQTLNAELLEVEHAQPWPVKAAERPVEAPDGPGGGEDAGKAVCGARSRAYDRWHCELPPGHLPSPHAAVGGRVRWYA